MDEIQVKSNVSKNLAFYRKLNNLTQTELAEKINYSDKSVSKWERGDGLPDICVLVQIANILNITVDDLIYDKEELEVKPVSKNSFYETNKIIFTYMLSIGLVWFIATLLSVI